MNIIQERETLKKRLRNKESRDAFVSAYTQTIPFQLRAMREQQDRRWTQEELAERAGMKQERISTLENPNYGKYSLRILKQLAAAFDVALMVRFVPFNELAEWKLNLSSKSLEVESFEQDDYFKEKPAEDTLGGTEILEKYYSVTATKQPKAEARESGIVIKLGERIDKQKEPYTIKKEDAPTKMTLTEVHCNEAAIG